jgi:methylthioribose-1-phosphate isomerase
MKLEQMKKHIEAMKLVADIPLPYVIRNKIINLIQTLNSAISTNEDNTEFYSQFNDSDLEIIKKSFEDLVISANNQHNIDCLLELLKEDR